MTVRSRWKALSDAFVRLAEAIEGEPPDSLESRVARLEQAGAAGAGCPDHRPDCPMIEGSSDQPSA